jgi:hypothetical protein
MSDLDNLEEPSAEYHHLLAEFHAQEQARLDDAMARLRDVIFPRLGLWGVTHVIVDFVGPSSSGRVEGISYLDATNQPVNMNLVRAASDPDIADIVRKFLQAGAENAGAGQGFVVLSVQDKSLRVVRGKNDTATHNTLMEFSVQ